MADLLRKSTANAIRRLLAQSKTTRQIPVRPASVSRHMLMVRCTSEQPAGASGISAECFPAVVVDLHSTELVADQPELGEVWLTVISGDSVITPESDARYLGILIGEHTEGEDTRPRVVAASAVGSGGDHSGDYCGFAALKPTDCLEATNSFDGSAIRVPNSAPGVWTSEGDVDYPEGTGPLVFTYADGEISVTLDGLELIRCDDGCWMGGPLTGHADDTEGDEACDGETFAICFRCACCPFASYAGPGWYCLEVDSVCTPVEILGDGDECEDWVYCSGPFETEEEAQIECGIVNICACEPSAEYPFRLYVTIGDGVNETTLPVDFNGSYWESARLPTPTWWQGATCTLSSKADDMRAQLFINCNDTFTCNVVAFDSPSPSVATNFGVNCSGGGSCGAVPGGTCTPTRPISWSAAGLTNHNGSVGGCIDHGTITSMDITETP